MNNNRRKILKKAVLELDSLYDIISDVLSDEQDCLDNIPENLQGTERYEKMEDCVSLLDDVISSIDDARNNIEEIIG